MRVALLLMAVAAASCGPPVPTQGTHFQVLVTGSLEPNIYRHMATGRCYVGDTHHTIVETGREVCDTAFAKPAVEVEAR